MKRALILMCLALAGCGGDSGGGSTHPKTEWRIQLPINENGNFTGRYAQYPTPPDRPPYYVGTPRDSKFMNPGKPCATSPNSSGCRTELRHLIEWKTGTLRGKVALDRWSGEGEGNTSIIQVCGKRIGCPALMIKVRSDGQVAWHTNNEKDGKKAGGSKGAFSERLVRGKAVGFNLHVDGAKSTLKLGDETQTIPIDPKAGPFHFKYGCYSSGRCEAQFNDTKAIPNG